MGDECLEKYNQIKMKKDLRYVIFKISDDKKSNEREKEAPKTATYEDMLGDMTADVPRYMLVDFPTQNKDAVEIEKLVLLAFIPDDCGVKLKMLYASSLDALKKKIPGVQKSVQCSDLADMAYDEVNNSVKG